MRGPGAGSRPARPRPAAPRSRGCPPRRRAGMQPSRWRRPQPRSGSIVRVRDRPARLDGDRHGRGDRAVDRRLRQAVALRLGEQRARDNDDQGAGDGGGEQRHDRAGIAAQQPSDASAEGQDVGARCQASEAEAQRKGIGIDPASPIQQLAMQRAHRRATAAQREIAVAGEHVCNGK